MLVATLAIAGVFPLAGFFSKDEILWHAWENGGPLLWGVGLTGAFLTAFYMFRLYFMTFSGAERLTHEAKHHLHESPNSMTIPLLVLAVLSVVGGWINIPMIHGGQILGHFLEPVFSDVAHVAGGAAHHGAAAGDHAAIELTLMVISLLVALAGIFLAHRFYVVDPGAPQRVVERVRGLYALLRDKYRIDELYDRLFVGPIVRGSVRLWERFDVAVIDRAVNGVGRRLERTAGALRQAQSGHVQVYAMVITLGTVVLLGYLALR
ncbi:MAG TPA: proton-conducting transporter membrane subunit, partial [Candidatus Eisenbacteria bacterium]|nr:proton-conducting transporter membrane subunit [Candidatus Eisenbacteria bacterium]